MFIVQLPSCLVLFKSEVEAEDAVGVPKEPKDKLGVKAAITNRYDKTVLLQKRVVVGVGQSACGVTGICRVISSRTVRKTSIFH